MEELVRGLEQHNTSPKWLLQFWLARQPLEDGDVKPLNEKLARIIEALSRPPQVTVGTIHSVKGGQADTVIIDTTLSLKPTGA